MKQLILSTRPAIARTAITVINMEGVLDLATAIDFESQLREVFNQKGYNVVLSMKNLTYVSSRGFEALIRVNRVVQKNKGEMKITCISPDVYEAFQLLELHNFFKILKSEDDAVKAF